MTRCTAIILIQSLIDVSRMYTLEYDIPPNSNTQTAFAVTLNDERE